MSWVLALTSTHLGALSGSHTGSSAHADPHPAEITPKPDYDPVAHISDPELAAYSPPAALAKQFQPSDWALWDKIKPVALAEGIEPDQLNKLAAKVMEFSAAQVQAQFDHADRQAEAEAKRHFGADYAQAMSDAGAAIKEYGNSRFVKFLELEVAGVPGLRFGSLPSVIDFMARVGKAMRGTGSGRPLTGGRDNGMPGQQQGAAGGLREQIRALEAAHPIGQRTNAQHAEIAKLYEALYPDDEEVAYRPVRMLNHKMGR